MFEYKTFLVVDAIPELNEINRTENISLQIELDVLAKQKWEVISCSQIDAGGLYAGQLCWAIVAKKQVKPASKRGKKK